MNATSKSRNYWRYGRNIMTGALAAVAMVALGVSQAQAVDGKLYPASMCVRCGGSASSSSDASQALQPRDHRYAPLTVRSVHDFIDESIQDGYVDVIDQNNDFSDQNHGPTDMSSLCISYLASPKLSSSSATGYGSTELQVQLPGCEFS